MYSSNDNTTTNNICIGNALLHATMQLTVPMVTSTSSIAKKFRSNSSSEESLSLSTLSISYPKYSTHLNKRKNRPETISYLSSFVPYYHSKKFELNTPTTTKKTSLSSSNEYLSVKKLYHCSRSTSCLSIKHNKSIKSTLFDICQGLNTNEIQSSPINPRHHQGRIKRIRPRWRTFSKVVVALLTFTRTKKEKYEWIQLVGHPGTFKEGVHDGYVLKELCDYERDCCEILQYDILKDFVPKYNGIIKDDQGKLYIEMEDLLSSFHQPCIMDCKIGVRTYLEEELDKSEHDPKPRADLYNKMIAIDPSAPTEKENEEQKILKTRYMIWRESLSSTHDLGFRIEAIKKSGGLMSKEFQRIKERDDVKKQFIEFIAYSLSRATSYLNRLIELRATCLRSNFIQTHELIGSSILFVHDETKASLWMIDFGKTRLLPKDIHITHLIPWIRGSHEDGYLFGLDNLISIFQEIIHELRLI